MKQKNICKGLKFSDCELTILRMAVDKAEEKIGKRIFKITKFNMLLLNLN